MSQRSLWALPSLGLFAGCLADSDLTPVLGCEPASGIEVDCQFQNPEDLAPSPDGRILVSQFGGMDGSEAGSLAIYDPAARKLEVLFPNAAPLDSSWGDPACPPPDRTVFSPHGLDIERRDDGRHQLAVVNHGGRESVDLTKAVDVNCLASHDTLLYTQLAAKVVPT